MLRRFIALFHKEFLQVRRDPQTLKLLFILPILQSLVLGYAMTRDVDHIKFGVLDWDQTAESRDVLLALTENNSFYFTRETQSLKEMERALLKGEITLGVVILGDFARNLEGISLNPVPGNHYPEARIALLVDGEDAASASIAVSYANAILMQWMRERAFHSGNTAGELSSALTFLDLRDNVLFNPELDYHWYMVPGMIILLTTMIGALLTSFSLVRERESGTLEQLCVTPVSPLQIVLGKAFPYWILSQISFLFSFLIVGLWFGIPLENIHLTALLPGLALFAFAVVSLGILVSTLVTSQQQALFLIWFFLVFFVLTSGFLLPFESMPLWMQYFTESNIVRHFLYAVRSITLRGAILPEVLPEYLKLTLISCVMLILGVLLFRRKAG